MKIIFLHRCLMKFLTEYPTQPSNLFLGSYISTSRALPNTCHCSTSKLQQTYRTCKLV